MRDLQRGVALQGLTKSYGGNTVLTGVDLTFAPGTVHCLLGANGAGKSTLLSCLSGAVTPDSGEISVGSHTTSAFTPREAFNAGIAIIYQHFQLIGSLSAADNVFLGQEVRGLAGTVDKGKQDSEARRIFAELGIDIDPKAIVERLSVGEQQMVEIARSIYRRPQVLILDEPTAALGAHEVAALHTLVDRLAHQEGLAIVYVTHLLGEVMSIADEVTVLRDGKIYWTRNSDDVTMGDLVEGISPAASLRQTRQAFNAVGRRPVAELDEFSSSFSGPINLTVHEGEVVGVYGLLGSGRTDLLEALAGEGASTGTLRIDGKRIVPRSPKQAQRRGIALVASDRQAQSLFGTLSAQENLLMPHYGRLARLLRRPRVEQRLFNQAASAVGLRPPNPNASADSFSGGNAQKIAVARWTIAGEGIRCLLLDEPTQGVDIGARVDLYSTIRQFTAQQEAAAIFASSDPDEVIALADTVVILREGRVVFVGRATEVTESEIVRIAQPEITQESAA